MGQENAGGNVEKNRAARLIPGGVPLGSHNSSVFSF